MVRFAPALQFWANFLRVETKTELQRPAVNRNSLFSSQTLRIARSPSSGRTNAWSRLMASVASFERCAPARPHWPRAAGYLCGAGPGVVLQEGGGNMIGCDDAWVAPTGSLQVASFRARHHLVRSALVSSLFALVPRRSGTAVRARTGRRTHDSVALDSALRSRVESKTAAAFEADDSFVAYGRNLRPCKGHRMYLFRAVD